MFLSHLSLTHYRNYRRLELDFSGSFTLVQGQNAQGKTNLLEAIYFLATSKPVHALNEREVVDWQAVEEPIPYSRLAGRVQDDAEGQRRQLDLEILLTPRDEGGSFKKQIKVNGVSRRAMDFVGLLRAVIFLPEDIKLVDGGPAERRRYIDIALCQIDRSYCQSLASYQKVLAQRNSLLRLLGKAENPTAPVVDAQLSFWDERLVQHGSAVIARRLSFLERLGPLAGARHLELSGGERLEIGLIPSFNPGHLSDAAFERLRQGRPLGEESRLHVSADEVAAHYLRKLRSRRGRELAAGSSLYGPHRDDLRFLADGHDLRAYGSRGQQRTAALALKLAEAAVSTEETGSTPLLLLDDVMSELDVQRRGALLTALAGVRQAVLTTTDWDDYTPEFRRQAQRLYVQGGIVSAAGEGDE